MFSIRLPRCLIHSSRSILIFSCQELSYRPDTDADLKVEFISTTRRTCAALAFMITAVAPAQCGIRPTPKRWVMITSWLRVIRLIHDRLRVPPFLAFLHSEFNPLLNLIPDPQKTGSCSQPWFLSIRLTADYALNAKRGACRYPHAQRPSSPRI
jgi:hypothetical protein